MKNDERTILFSRGIPLPDSNTHLVRRHSIGSYWLNRFSVPSNSRIIGQTQNDVSNVIDEAKHESESQSIFDTLPSFSTANLASTPVFTQQNDKSLLNSYQSVPENDTELPRTAYQSNLPLIDRKDVLLSTQNDEQKSIGTNEESNNQKKEARGHDAGLFSVGVPQEINKNNDSPVQSIAIDHRHRHVGPDRPKPVTVTERHFSAITPIDQAGNANTGTRVPNEISLSAGLDGALPYNNTTLTNRHNKVFPVQSDSAGKPETPLSKHGQLFRGNAQSGNKLQSNEFTRQFMLTQTTLPSVGTQNESLSALSRNEIEPGDHRYKLSHKLSTVGQGVPNGNPISAVEMLTVKNVLSLPPDQTIGKQKPAQTVTIGHVHVTVSTAEKKPQSNRPPLPVEKPSSVTPHASGGRRNSSAWSNYYRGFD